MTTKKKLFSRKEINTFLSCYISFHSKTLEWILGAVGETGYDRVTCSQGKLKSSRRERYKDLFEAKYDTCL